ncbi:hypothetical protein Dimus_007877 [Dionaea muscipula]
MGTNLGRDLFAEALTLDDSSIQTRIGMFESTPRLSLSCLMSPCLHEIVIAGKCFEVVELGVNTTTLVAFVRLGSSPAESAHRSCCSSLCLLQLSFPPRALAASAALTPSRSERKIEGATERVRREKETVRVGERKRN